MQHRIDLKIQYNVFAVFLFLRKGTIFKAAYKAYLGLAYRFFFLNGESMTNMAGSMAASRQAWD